jgi:hypothetical protein
MPLNLALLSLMVMPTNTSDPISRPQIDTLLGKYEPERRTGIIKDIHKGA